jgi:hypothetical protein
MAKKVFRGWCRGNESISTVGVWDSWNYGKLDLDVWKTKGIQDQPWPLRRVIVTVEFENEVKRGN